jgi:phosphoserine aminotransferase
MLPLPVLERIREELPDWQQTGMSVMEVSHRSKEFVAAAEQAEANLRRLLGIPDNYSVLFAQGGASLQFSMVPLNLAADGDPADYINTGAWSKKAIKEAQRYCDVNVAASAQDSGFTAIPPVADWSLSGQAAYVHYTPNETIGGVEFHFVPDTAGVPLVADMSSTILSRPIDVSRFGVIYAGAQKNIGPAGICVVIVRRDLLSRCRESTPTLLKWAEYDASGSMSNTPPTFAWYVAGLVFEHLLECGGLSEVGRRNERKARLLYEAVDQSAFYSNPVDTDCRSWMNVPFVLATPELDAVFLREAGERGLTNLKGHRSVGGMRASIYNAMPEEGVLALIEFMQDFERRHG